MSCCPRCGTTIDPEQDGCDTCGIDRTSIAESEHTESATIRTDGGSTDIDVSRRQVLAGGATLVALVGGGWYVLSGDEEPELYLDWLHEPDLVELAESTSGFGDDSSDPDTEFIFGYYDIPALREHGDELIESPHDHTLVEILDRDHLDVSIDDVDSFVELSSFAANWLSILRLEIIEADVSQITIDQWWEPGEDTSVITSHRGFDLYTVDEETDKAWAFGDETFLVVTASEAVEDGAALNSVLRDAIDVYHGDEPAATATDEDVVTLVDHLGAPMMLWAHLDVAGAMADTDISGEARRLTSTTGDTVDLEQLILFEDTEDVDEDLATETADIPSAATIDEVTTMDRTVSIDFSMPIEEY